MIDCIGKIDDNYSYSCSECPHASFCVYCWIRLHIKAFGSYVNRLTLNGSSSTSGRWID